MPSTPTAGGRDRGSGCAWPFHDHGMNPAGRVALHLPTRHMGSQVSNTLMPTTKPQHRTPCLCFSLLPGMRVSCTQSQAELMAFPSWYPATYGIPLDDSRSFPTSPGSHSKNRRCSCSTSTRQDAVGPGTVAHTCSSMVEWRWAQSQEGKDCGGSSLLYSHEQKPFAKSLPKR